MVYAPATRRGRRSAPTAEMREDRSFAMAGLSYLAMAAVIFVLGVLAARF
jgi:hypothetical protein